MYCSACGAYNDDRATRCEECGATLYPDAGEEQMQYEPVDIPNYLVQSILVTICCCLPFGIVAIVFAAQVNGLVERGDYAAAQEKSRLAKLWCWIGFGIGAAVTLIWIALQVIAAMVTMN